MSRSARACIVAGAIAQVAGIAIDAWLHLADPTLAAREALLTFANAGHVLLLGGLALVVVGVALLTVGPRIARMSRPWRYGVPVASVACVAVLSLFAFNSSLAGGHDHGSHDHSSSNGHSGSHDHGDGTVPDHIPLTDEERETLATQLVTAREVALRYPTVADAERAGYRKVTDYEPLIGAHYMRFVITDGTFDVTQPEMLLYDGTAPDDEMVGLSYYVVGDDAPEGFAGPNDHWHRHIGLCIDLSQTLVVGDETTPDDECRELGGTKVEGRDGWMVHAWVVPAWESPQGVFSAANLQLD